jgi:APA family basic amino acid/polyamine antiporter
MPKLKREITLFGLTMIAIGSCVGSGIFFTPHDMANDLPSGGLTLAAWIVGGVISICGALTFAELGGLFPKTGGVYVFLKEAFGEVFGFLYGWCILLAVTSGAIAALSLGFAECLGYFWDITDGQKMAISLTTLAAITLINIFGVRLSQLASSSLTVLKIIGIAFIVIVAVTLSGKAPEGNFSLTLEHSDPWGAFALALTAVLWSFGGWHHASYLAGETRNPAKTLPRAMLFGVVAVTVIYLATNVGYLYLLPLGEIAESRAFAANAVASVLPVGGTITTILILVSIFGTMAIYGLTAPRIYFKLAEDGLFFPLFAKVNAKWNVPIWAIILQSGWAVVLLLFWGTFEDLLKYVVFTDWLFMLLAGISIFVFRKTMKHSPRPYKTWGYPVIPLIFILIVGWFIVSILRVEPMNAIAGLILLAAGFPVFYVFKFWQSKK